MKLNKGRVIDYDKASQRKYYLYYMQNGLNDINQDYNETAKIQGAIFCLDENFKDVAIKEIGEERLRNYLKEC